MSYILDTDIITYIMKNNQTVKARLQEAIIFCYLNSIAK